MMRRGWMLAIALAAGIASATSAVAHPGSSAQIEELSDRIAADPTDAQLRLRRADLYRRAGHLHDAMADLARVARIDPHNRDLHLQRALVFVARGKLRVAEAQLDTFLAEGPGHALAHRERARLRQRDGRWPAARADYDAAIAIAPTPDLYLDRARVDVALGDLDAAAEGLAEGCDTLSDPIVLELALVRAQIDRGRPELALPHVDALLARSPDHAEWVLLRAEVLAASARADEALGERLRALVLSVTQVAVRPTALHRLARAKIYLALQRPAAALSDLQAAVAIAPDLHEATTLLAEVEESLG